MSEHYQVALITGAGSGIGKACAIRFADAGVRVALTDINAQKLERTAAEIAASGGVAMQLIHDVSDEDSSQQVVKQVLAEWGQIDMLVANAGVQIAGSLLAATEQDWDTILAVNLKGVAYCCKAVIPAMQQQCAGAIVMVASINAVVGSAGMAIYDMSKAGLLGLMRNLAVEFGADGIRVNAISPGNTLTEFHLDPMIEKGITIDQINEMTKGYGLLGRVAKPAEIANAVHFLASDQSSFITGHNLIVDGGFSITGRA
ncbi:MAG: SDR family oxidoreductase [Xanthomonadales bacterium]|nr:SDR family oxidoreductase [Xanthomonadales bacterium]